jgi:hypothetical protein
LQAASFDPALAQQLTNIPSLAACLDLPIRSVGSPCAAIHRRMVMRRSEFAEAADPANLVEHLDRYVTEQGAAAVHGQAHGAMESVREATYRGHQIVIRTTYHIEVDGQPIEGHVGVTNDGRVHYHAVPNLSFPSAVDMVKQLIDTFHDDFHQPVEDHDHGAHGEEHDHPAAQEHDHERGGKKQRRGKRRKEA